MIRLGINIDHVATLRNARCEFHPNPLYAAKFVKKLGAGCDEEAIRVLKKSKFKPGYDKGKPVKVRFTLPIFFRL